MKLLRDGSMFNDIHRHGWPFVMQGLHRVADGKGILLDDFVEATWNYSRVAAGGHKKPWVGILHHPDKVSSPLPHDKGCELHKLFARREFIYSREKLKGIIVMSPRSELVVKKLMPEVPVLCVRHPTDLDVMTWDTRGRRSLFQVGFFLRNTRFVHSFQVKKDWTVKRCAPFLGWHKARDKLLKRIVPRVNFDVQEVERLGNAEYDVMMASNIICMQTYGAAANNVLIECIARRTPILLNRTPAAEYYLGHHYPLFFSGDRPNEDFLSNDRIDAAYHYLLSLDSHPISIEHFTKKVVDFIKGL